MSKKKKTTKIMMVLDAADAGAIQEVLDGAANFSMSLPGSTSKATDRASELALAFQNALEDPEQPIFKS